MPYSRAGRGLRIPPMIDPRAEQFPPANPPTARTRVLVADDDAASRRLLALTLEALGFAAQTAGDGVEAMQMVESDPPAIILLDFEMPRLNGAETCARLRQHPRAELRNIPVIMLTAHTGEADEVACLGAGANDFIAKPSARASLAARVETQVRLRALNDVLRTQNEELARWREAQMADLEAAQRVQRAILPTHHTLPGWNFAVRYAPLIQVGGDIYGVVPMGDSGLVWLADAAGHGVAAALCTTLVARLFDRAAKDADPGRILARVNVELHEIFHGKSMMSAACALLLPDGEICFAGAGHPPLLIRRVNGEVESIASKSTLLGIGAEVSSGVQSVRLAAGESALLYTDGLYSSQTADGTRQTIENLSRVFSNAPELSPLIDRMRGESSFDDDLTAILIERGSSVSPAFPAPGGAG